MAAANAVVVDDSNIGILYNGAVWFKVTTNNQFVHNGTLSGADGPGFFEYIFIGEWFCVSISNAVGRTRSIGSQIAVFGTISPTEAGKIPTAVTSVYLIDNVTVGTYTAQNFTQEADGIQFWTSGELEVIHHILTVNITTATPDYPFLFDYLLFMPPATLTSSDLSDSSASDSSTLNTFSSVSNGLSLSAPSSSTKSTASTSSPSATTSLVSLSTSKHIDIGAIVGGVVGGVATSCAMFLVLFFCWRRRRQALKLYDESNGVDIAPSLLIAL